MGLIKEPKGIDLVVAPSILTEHDQRIISDVIAAYKRLGKLPPLKGVKRKTRKRKTA